jgi:hypothetical protein
MSPNAYQAFKDLLLGLSGYLDELSPYEFDPRQALFPQLPLELREFIYSYLLLPKNYHMNHIEVECMLRRPLFRINEHTRIDVGLYLIRTHPLYIDDVASRDNVMIPFLESFPGEHGFECVRSLYFWRFSYQIPKPGSTVNENIRLMQRCTGLRNVDLRWESIHLQELPPPRFPELEVKVRRMMHRRPAFPSVQDVVQRYHLEGLFALDSVQRITLWIVNTDIVYIGGGLGRDAILFVIAGLLGELCAWMEKRFLELGRTVVVKCEFERRVC